MIDLSDPETREIYEKYVETVPKCEFGFVLRFLKEGRRMSRAGWNGLGQFIELQVPDENSKMTVPYIFITTVQGDRVPWLASQTDMLAMDWYPILEL